MSIIHKSIGDEIKCQYARDNIDIGIYLIHCRTIKAALIAICAGCAYEAGYKAGLNRERQINMNLDALPESQAGTIRYKNPHAAFAEGYRAGVKKSYGEINES